MVRIVRGVQRRASRRLLLAPATRPRLLLVLPMARAKKVALRRMRHRAFLKPLRERAVMVLAARAAEPLKDHRSLKCC